MAKLHMSVINFNERWTDCCMCGKPTLYQWGIPISAETALIVSNDFDGRTGGVSVCETCYKLHKAGEFVGQDTRY